MPLRSYICNSKWYQLSFVSCTVSASWITTCIEAYVIRWVYMYFSEKNTLCNNFIQNRGCAWAYFQRWSYFWEITIYRYLHIHSVHILRSLLSIRSPVSFRFNSWSFCSYCRNHWHHTTRGNRWPRRCGKWNVTWSSEDVTEPTFWCHSFCQALHA